MSRARLAALAAAAILSISIAGPALAVAPNDELGSAIAVHLNEIVSIDTTDATAGATDPTTCTTPFGETFDGPYTNSAWWRLDASADASLHANANTFDFLAILFVFDGDLDHMVGCSAFPAEVTWDALAGHTYYFMIAGLAGEPGGHGEFSVSEALLINLTVNSSATTSASTGIANITGTVTCSRSADFVDVGIDLRQQVGRKTIEGFGDAFMEGCPTTPTAWTAPVEGFNGKFLGGKATAMAFATACDQFGCTDAGPVTAVIKLKVSR